MSLSYPLYSSNGERVHHEKTEEGMSCRDAFIFFLIFFINPLSLDCEFFFFFEQNIYYSYSHIRVKRWVCRVFILILHSSFLLIYTSTITAKTQRIIKRLVLYEKILLYEKTFIILKLNKL